MLFARQTREVLTGARHSRRHPSPGRQTQRSHPSACGAAVGAFALALALAAPAATGEPTRVGPSLSTAPPSAATRAVAAPDWPPVTSPLAGPRLGDHAMALTYAAAQPAATVRQVCVNRANVRSGPGTAYPVVGTLGRGASVKGPVAKGWLKLRNGQWVSTTVTCATRAGATPKAAAKAGSAQSFQAWARALDPAGSATWKIDYSRAHTQGPVRGLTVFHSWGQSRSTVYIQPGMSWAKTRMVMAHEAIHVRQIRYGGFRHSLNVFGSIPGMERAADCGASLTLRYVVRGGCSSALTAPVRKLLSGRAA